GCCLLSGCLTACRPASSAARDPGETQLPAASARAQGQLPESFSLAVPSGYSRIEKRKLMPAAEFESMRLSSGSAAHLALRALHIQPAALAQLRVLFSSRSGQPLELATVNARPEVLATMNWVFFGRLPAGEIQGDSCTDTGKTCVAGMFQPRHPSEREQAERRYALAIDEMGHPQLLRGGLKHTDSRSLRLFLGGGILLFDGLDPKYRQLYRAVGHPNYLRHYTAANDPALIAPGQAGDPTRQAPRTAIGLLPDHSLILLNLGEGQYRLRGGVTPARLAELLQQLGAIAGLMFDGGGATLMHVRNTEGRVLAATRPEITSFSDFRRNYAFLVLVSRPSR
ncbi:MAG: phosphodiester glycosidase family protein, partial [Candidatus Sericytochromatia bacterium]